MSIWYKEIFFFCYWVVSVWNSLPDYVVEADSVNSFKVGWINTGPMKSSFLTLTQNLWELEVYQFVCNGIKWYACMVCRCGHRGYTWARLHCRLVLSCVLYLTDHVPHHSVFYWPDALPAAQPTASKHWRHIKRQLEKIWKTYVLCWSFGT